MGVDDVWDWEDSGRQTQDRKKWNKGKKKADTARNLLWMMKCMTHFE